MWNRRILIALATTSIGCALDPKTVGQGTATDSDSGSGSDESGSEESEGSASEGSASSSASSNATTPTEGSSDDGECLEEGCPWEPCADAPCGMFCNICPPWDEDCGQPGTYTVCAASGECEIWPEWDQDACPGQGLQPGFDDTLDQSGGCGDMNVFAANADATVALHLRVEGLVEEAHAAGEPIVRPYTAEFPELQLEVTFGTDLLVATCTDVAGNEPMAIEHWVPTTSKEVGSGTVVITVTPDLDNPPNATATVTIDGLALRRNDPDIFDTEVVIETMTIADVAVGWLPG